LRGRPDCSCKAETERIRERSWSEAPSRRVTRVVTYRRERGGKRTLGERSRLRGRPDCSCRAETERMRERSWSEAPRRRVTRVDTWEGVREALGEIVAGSVKGRFMWRRGERRGSSTKQGVADEREELVRGSEAAVTWVVTREGVRHAISERGKRGSPPPRRWCRRNSSLGFFSGKFSRSSGEF
jgi:hypothetical protein